MRLFAPALLAKYGGAPLVTVPTDELRMLAEQLARLNQATAAELRRRERETARGHRATSLPPRRRRGAETSF